MPAAPAQMQRARLGLLDQQVVDQQLLPEQLLQTGGFDRANAPIVRQMQLDSGPPGTVLQSGVDLPASATGTPSEGVVVGQPPPQETGLAQSLLEAPLESAKTVVEGGMRKLGALTGEKPFMDRLEALATGNLMELGGFALLGMDLFAGPGGKAAGAARGVMNSPVKMKTGLRGTDLLLKHYSPKARTELKGDVLSVDEWGTGIPDAAAHKIADDVDLRRRTYFYTDPDVPPEPGLGPNIYIVPGANMYPLEKDPQGFHKLARDLLETQQEVYENARFAEKGFRISNPVPPGDIQNLAEHMIREAGYEGMYSERVNAGIRFNDTPLDGPTLNDIAAESYGSQRIAEETGVGSAIGTRHRRVKSGENKGQYVGSPGIASPQGLGVLRKGLIELAIEGIKGRFWYERSGEFIHQGFSGNRESTVGFVGALATTSPSTRVATNAEFAIRALNQSLAGDPIKSGIFPNPMRPRLERVLLTHAVLNGRKVSSFYGNILHRMFPDIPQGATADLWMMEAYGYKNAVPSEQQYNFIEREAAVVRDMMNAKLAPGERPWDVKQIQAAIWTAIKARKEKTPVSQAARDFSDVIRPKLVIESYETVPGRSSDILPGLADATDEMRELFHRDLNTRVLTDDFGNDVIHRELGLLQGGNTQGVGLFEGGTNPSTQVRSAVSLAPETVWGEEAVQKGLGDFITDKTGRSTFKLKDGATQLDRAKALHLQAKLDPSSKKLIDAAAATRAKVLKQNAGAWVKPTFLIKGRAIPAYAVDTFEFQTGKLHPSDVTNLNNILTKLSGKNENPFPIVPTEEGYVVFNPGEPGEKFSGFEAAEFKALIDEALGQWTLRDPVLRFKGDATGIRNIGIKVRAGIHDGNLMENNWRVNPNGEVYDDVIGGAGATIGERSARIQSELAQKIEARRQFWERELGFPDTGFGRPPATGLGGVAPPGASSPPSTGLGGP